jgi:hypothetical protein
MLIAESLAEAAEDVRHLQPFSGHDARASGRHEIRHCRFGDGQRF